MTSKKLMTAALSAALAFGMAGSALAVETLRVGHDQQKNHAYQVAGETLNTKLSAASSGAYEVKVFSGATLGTEMAMLDNVRAGNQDFTICSASNASSQLPFLGMLSVGYLFADVNHFKRTLNDKAFQTLIDEKIAAAKPGFHRISWFTAGVRDVYNNKRPIKTLEDLQNMKFRVMASPIESKVWATLGTKPLAIPFGEVYTGLQTGLAEAAENAAAPYLANKHNEVAPYFSETEHQWLIAFLLVSDKAWQKFPEAIRKSVTEIGAAMSDPVTDYAVKTDAQVIEDMAKKGVKVNKVEKKPFMDRLAPVQDEVAKELGMEAALKRIRELR